MDAIQKSLLEQIAGLHEVPAGAYNFRVNGQAAGRNTTANIDIVTKEDKPGIDIIIKPGTKKESVHIPVILSATGLKDLVYNDFYIGEGSDVTIVAGCGIHNGGAADSSHDGIHTFHIGKNARVRYVEKHYGEGDGMGKRVMNPTTVVEIAEGGYMEMDTVQIRGIDSTHRVTAGKLGKDATLIIREKIINGNNRCAGHSECDAIIMDEATVSAVPEITANNIDASLIHEAAIGKIAGEQIIKLMTLGLTEAEAEAQIVNGFLK